MTHSVATATVRLRYPVGMVLGSSGAIARSAASGAGRRSFVALALLGVCALSACRALDRERYYALLDGSGLVDGASDADVRRQDVSGPDAIVGPDALTGCPFADDAGTGMDASCEPARIPSRPTGLTDADGGTRIMTFVMRRLTFGFESRSLWGTHGFDRDGICTQATSPDPTQRACRPVDPMVPPVEDGERGRDNAVAARLGTFFNSTGLAEIDVNDAINDGDKSVVLRLSYYGGPNDSRVRVEWLPVTHGHPQGNPTGRPVWDGRDVWHIDSTVAYDATSPMTALVRSDSAFVRCGTLVAPIPSRVPIRFNGRRVLTRFTLSGGYMVGPVATDGSMIGPLEFSALWSISDALNDVASLGICPPPPLSREATWNVLRRGLETAADLLLSGDVSPDTPCDALSFVFASEWAPAQLGMDEPTAPRPENLCTLTDGGRG